VSHPLAKSPADLIITGGYLIPMNDRNEIFDPGAVAIAGDRILAAGPAADIEAKYEAKRTIDARGHAILPGLIDIYSHAGHGMVKAIVHPKRGWPSAKLYFHASTPSWWEAEAELSAIERVRFGTTTGHTVLGATPARVDDAVYADAHLKATLRVGTREVLSVGPPDLFISHIAKPWSATDWRSGKPVTREFDLQHCMDVCEDIISRWHGTHDERVRVTLHPPYLFTRQAQHYQFPYEYQEADIPAVTEHAEQMRAFADRTGVTMLTHAFRGSLTWAKKHFGAHLFDILKSDILFAHCNGLQPDEVEILAQGGASVVWSPSTHENCWYGITPVIAMLQAGLRVGICTDGNAPRFSMNLWKEIFRGTLMQNQFMRDRGVLPPGRALRMVTIEAARALGVGDLIGSLEPGKKADVITVDLMQPHLTPRAAVPNLLAYYAEGFDVATTVVGGRVLMQDRQLTEANMQETVRWAQQEADAAFARIGIDDYLTMDDAYWNGWEY